MFAAHPDRLFEIGTVEHERAEELQLPPVTFASFQRSRIEPAELLEVPLASLFQGFDLIADFFESASSGLRHRMPASLRTYTTIEYTFSPCSRRASRSKRYAVQASAKNSLKSRLPY